MTPGKIYPTSIHIKCPCGNTFTIRTAESVLEKTCHSCLRSFTVYLPGPRVTMNGQFFKIDRRDWAENRDK